MKRINPVLGASSATLTRAGPKFEPMVLSEERKKRPHFYTQSYTPLTLLALGVLALHGVAYCKPSDYFLPLVTGYIHTDMYLAALHMWLDDPVTLDNPIKQIAALAYQFQHHHDYPGDVFHDNHVKSIDGFVRITAVLFLACYWLAGLDTYRIPHFLSIGFWGFVGAANHVAMHCRTHKRKIPEVYRIGQDLGLLMKPKHHKAHHTAPFECYFSFLAGFNVVYTVIYKAALQHNRTLMTATFVALQPPTLVLLLSAASAASAASGFAG